MRSAVGRLEDPCRARFDEEDGMNTYVAPGDHRGKTAGLRLVSDATTFTSVRHPEPAPRETDERVRLQVSLAVALPLSLGLWALIWFALTYLISNWSLRGATGRRVAAQRCDGSRVAGQDLRRGLDPRSPASRTGR